MFFLIVNRKAQAHSPWIFYSIETLDQTASTLAALDFGERKISLSLQRSILLITFSHPPPSTTSVFSQNYTCRKFH